MLSLLMLLLSLLIAAACRHDDIFAAIFAVGRLPLFSITIFRWYWCHAAAASRLISMMLPCWCRFLFDFYDDTPWFADIFAFSSFSMPPLFSSLLCCFSPLISPLADTLAFIRLRHCCLPFACFSLLLFASPGFDFLSLFLFTLSLLYECRYHHAPRRRYDTLTASHHELFIAFRHALIASAWRIISCWCFLSAAAAADAMLYFAVSLCCWLFADADIRFSRCRHYFLFYAWFLSASLRWCRLSPFSAFRLRHDIAAACWLFHVCLFSGHCFFCRWYFHHAITLFAFFSLDTLMPLPLTPCQPISLLIADAAADTPLPRCWCRRRHADFADSADIDFRCCRHACWRRHWCRRFSDAFAIFALLPLMLSLISSPPYWFSLWWCYAVAFFSMPDDFFSSSPLFFAYMMLPPPPYFDAAYWYVATYTYDICW